MTDRIVILGAAGIVGRGIARQLSVDGVPDLLLVDVRGDAVGALAQELGMEAATVDVTEPSAMEHIMRGSRLTVNATLYYQNLAVMEACSGGKQLVPRLGRPLPHDAPSARILIAL